MKRLLVHRRESVHPVNPVERSGLPAMRGLGKRPWRITAATSSIADDMLEVEDIEGDTDEAAIEKSRRLQSHRHRRRMPQLSSSGRARL